MSEEAVERATRRIDNALERIEAAARLRREDHGVLARRHSELRGRVEAAIAALDEEISAEADD